MSGTKMQDGPKKCSAGAVPYMRPCFFLFPFWSGKGGEDTVVFFWMVESSVVVIQVQILRLEGTALLAVIIGNMMICVAPFATAWVRANNLWKHWWHSKQRNWSHWKEGFLPWWGLALSPNSQCPHHIQKLFYDDQYLKVLAYHQDHLI